MKKRKYKSEIMMVIHQHNEAMYKLGFVTDEEMRELNEDCLVAEPEPAFSNSPSSQNRPIIPAYAHTKA
jgi:DNA-binding transcriptional regulator YiaG